MCYLNAVHAIMQNGHTAVDLARVHHHSNLVELLECKSQGALLRAASEGGDTLIVKKLLNEGADVDSRDIVSGFPCTCTCTTYGWKESFVFCVAFVLQITTAKYIYISSNYQLSSTLW